MRYRIQAGDDDAYERALQYIDTLASSPVRVKLPERRVLSVEDLNETAIERLRGLGVEVEADFQWDPEGGAGFG